MMCNPFFSTDYFLSRPLSLPLSTVLSSSSVPSPFPPPPHHCIRFLSPFPPPPPRHCIRFLSPFPQIFFSSYASSLLTLPSPIPYLSFQTHFPSSSFSAILFSDTFPLHFSAFLFFSPIYCMITIMNLHEGKKSVAQIFNFHINFLNFYCV